MIRSLKEESLMPLALVRWQRLRARMSAAAAKPRRASAWWSRGATALSMAYLLASQALIDTPGWSASAGVFAALLTGLVAVGAYFGVWRVRAGKWMVVPTIFVGYCLLRCFSGIEDTAPFGTFAQMATAILGGIVVAVALRVAVSFKAIIYAQLAASLLQIVVVLFGLGPESQSGEDLFRHAGTTGNPNLLALQLTFGACLIWLLPRKSGVLPCAFALVAVAFAVAMTGSRKAVLTGGFFLVLGIVQAVALVPKKRRRLILSLAAATACLIGFFLGYWLYQNEVSILAVRRTLEYEDNSYLTRALMIQQGLQLWQQAPLFGHGMDAFRGLSGQDTYAHNNIAELLCDVGLVGTLLFYSLHAQVLIRAAQARPLLRFSCWIFVLMLILTDTGSVSYTNKQAVMILMILTVVTTSRYGFQHPRHAGKPGGRVHSGWQAKLRRFVMQS